MHIIPYILVKVKKLTFEIVLDGIPSKFYVIINPQVLDQTGYGCNFVVDLIKQVRI